MASSYKRIRLSPLAPQTFIVHGNSWAHPRKEAGRFGLPSVLKLVRFPALPTPQAKNAREKIQIKLEIYIYIYLEIHIHTRENERRKERREERREKGGKEEKNAVPYILHRREGFALLAGQSASLILLAEDASKDHLGRVEL